MAMPPGNVIPSDKMQFPAAVATDAAGEIHRQWIPDERDWFISWLRSEFAAANAIIDSLCQHLRAVGDPSEYDAVIGTIQRRRFNWTPALHMQQYFSVAEVAYMLQQVEWKQQQQRGSVVDHGRIIRRSEVGFSQHDRSEKSEENKSNGGNVGIIEDKGLSAVDDKRGSGTDASAKPNADTGSSKSPGKLNVSSVGNGVDHAEVFNHKCTSSSKDNISASDQKQNGKQNLPSTPKTFVATEIYNGKSVAFDVTRVNVVEGMKLYNELFDGKEVSKLVSMVNDLRVSGRRGQLQGQTYVVNKRPMRGHGREMIQLGLPIADAPVDDEKRRVEPMPSFLQDVIERLVNMQIVPVKPDSCIIDFYNEGDHSQPHMFVPWVGRPVCFMFLSECDMTFGRVIVSDHPGEYKGSLKLSITSGSLLVMQGRSADFSKHAIHSIRKQRTIITLAKSQPKKSITGPTSSSLPPPSHWGSPPLWSPNHHIRHPTCPTNHYTGVLPTPPLPPRPQIPPPNGVQPLFVTAPLEPAMPFPAPPVPIPPGSTGWPAPPPPRHPPPRIPLPGTGVFLPPSGSGNPPNQEAGLLLEKENDSRTLDHGNLDVKAKQEEVNGSVEGNGEESVVGKQSS